MDDDDKAPPKQRASTSDGLIRITDLHTTLETLTRLANDPNLLRDLDPRHRLALTKAADALSGRPPRRRRRIPAQNQAIDEATLQEALKRRAAIEAGRARRPCYVCGTPTVVDVDAMCLACRAAEEATATALVSANQRQLLRDHVVVVTGGRVNIGFAVAVAALRLGARVIATTRFADDARIRFAACDDASSWMDRLEVYGLDLRDLPGVETFAAHLAATVPAIDGLIHNAAQTLPLSGAALKALQTPALVAANHRPSLASLTTTKAPYTEALAALAASPSTLVVDETLGPYGTRPAQSWQARVEDVSTRELLEVLLVNAAAPFVLTRALLPLLRRSHQRPRTVVNVTSSEGRFSFSPRAAHDDGVLDSASRGERRGKSVRHPHLNMAKAALNMLTRTSATELRGDDVVMVAVDPGWVSGPLPRGGFDNGRFPLDADEAARRVLHPLLSSASGTPLTPGVLYKNYRPAPW